MDGLPWGCLSSKNDKLEKKLLAGICVKLFDERQKEKAGK